MRKYRMVIFLVII